MSYYLRIFSISHALFALFTLDEASCVGADVDPPTHVESLPATIDETCRDRFLKEAVPAWNALRERLRGIELELTYVSHLPEEPDPESDVCTSCLLYESMTSTYSILKEGFSRRLDRGKSIDVTNSLYSFKVTVSESANAYSLAEYEIWQHGAPQPRAGWLDIAEMNLAMFSNIYWCPIEKIVANDDFVMTGADCGVNNAGEEVVRIVYRYTGKASESDFDLKPGGVYWAELLPARHWVVARSALTASMTEDSLSDLSFQARVTTRYQEWDGVPLPEEVRIESVDLRKNAFLRVQENRFGPPRECTRPIEEASASFVL